MNKRVLTMLVLMALAATPAFAYVQPGTFVGSDKSLGLATPNPLALTDIDSHGTISIVPSESPVTDGASAPVPEPGTMAMASMGLMALGATLRRRRGR